MSEFYEVVQGFEDFPDGAVVSADCFLDYELQSFLAQGWLRLAGEGEGVSATDAARVLADELGVDLAEVEGSGVDGRVVIEDVRLYAEE